MSDGTRVSLLDNGVDQRVADRHAREREAYHRERDARIQECDAHAELFLASYQRSVTCLREHFAQATATVSGLTQRLADNVVTVANAEAACRAAEHAIEAARVEARIEVAEWMAATKTEHVRTVEGGEPLTRDETFTYLVDTSRPVWDARNRASPVYHALWDARQTGEQWRGQLAEALRQTIELPPRIAEQEPMIGQYEALVRSHREQAAQRSTARAAYVAPPVVGRALEEARWYKMTKIKRIW